MADKKKLTSFKGVEVFRDKRRLRKAITVRDEKRRIVGPKFGEVYKKDVVVEGEEKKAGDVTIGASLRRYKSLLSWWGYSAIEAKIISTSVFSFQGDFRSGLQARRDKVVVVMKKNNLSWDAAVQVIYDRLDEEDKLVKDIYDVLEET
jgi:hypothetical protein